MNIIVKSFPELLPLAHLVYKKMEQLDTDGMTAPGSKYI